MREYKFGYMLENLVKHGILYQLSENFHVIQITEFGARQSAGKTVWRVL